MLRTTWITGGHFLADQMLKFVLQRLCCPFLVPIFFRMLVLDSVPLWNADGDNLIDELEEAHKLLDI